MHVDFLLPNSRFNQKKKTFIEKSGEALSWWAWSCRLGWADTNVTLAFEDAQFIPSFSRGETNDTDNTDDTDNIDDTDATENTDDTDDTGTGLNRLVYA